MLEVGQLAQWSLLGTLAGTFVFKRPWAGIARITLALPLMLQPGAGIAQPGSALPDQQNSSSRFASASLRITLTIPPRAQLLEATDATAKLCLSHMPASQLLVSWLPQTGAQAPGASVASLTGDTVVAGCVDLGVLSQAAGSTATVLIAAQ